VTQGGRVSAHSFLLALATFAVGTDAFIIAGILPQLAHELRVSIGAAGLIVSVFSISYAVGAPIASALSARVARTTVLVGGLAVFAAANILSALSNSLPLLLATRVSAALAAALVSPTCYAVASGLGSQASRGRNLAVVAAGFTSSMVLGVPVGVYVGQLFSWRGSFGFVALLGIVAAAALLKIGVPSLMAAAPATSLKTQLHAAGRWNTLFVLAPFLLWTGASLALYTYIAAILGQHLPTSLIPILLSIYGIGAVGGNMLGGFLSDRLGMRAPTIALLVVVTVTMAAMRVVGGSVVVTGMLMTIWAVCGSGLFTLQQQRVIASNPEQSNLMLALNNSALYFGASLGTAIEGAVISATSLNAAPTVSGALAAVALILLVALPQPIIARESRPRLGVSLE
jgi:MFS transporter, DHA1 family, inner membrane transport protein